MASAGTTLKAVMDFNSASATLDAPADDIGDIVTIPRYEQDTGYDEGSDLRIGAERGLPHSRQIPQNRSGES